MAFHLHLIDLLSDHVRLPGPRLSHNDRVGVPHRPQLSLQWELASDGRLYSRWIRN